MKDRYKLILIYFILFIQSLVLAYLFDVDGIYVRAEINSIVIINIINIIIFITLSKIFKVKSSSVTKFLLVILVLFSELIIDKEYLLSFYTQSTPQSIFPFYLLSELISIILLPFGGIFDFLYVIGVYDLAFLIIPCFILSISLISRKILIN
ncbi:hypothetical protein [Clostridium gasigenes]|uniref:hypothetical protein n=1 Tax=Clostridium gasigenes TaxID=94869 RepID=UPI001C0C649F|nr:hypothetical protein [Clostridium gasigenes]MBU3106207.1 hypothetical protein [Clostridium gasigenes]